MFQNSWTRIAGLVAFKLSLFLIASLVGCGKQEHPSKGGDVFLESNHNDIGIVSPKVKVSTKFVLVNQSNKAVKISRIAKSCRCTDVQIVSGSIGPRQKLEVPIVISTPSESGEFFAEMAIYTDSQVEPIQATVRADVVRSLQTEIDVCEFGNFSKLDAPSRKIRVRVVKKHFLGPIMVESSEGASCVLSKVGDNDFDADVQLQIDKLTGGLMINRSSPGYAGEALRV